MAEASGNVDGGSRRGAGQLGASLDLDGARFGCVCNHHERIMISEINFRVSRGPKSAETGRNLWLVFLMHCACIPENRKLGKAV